MRPRRRLRNFKQIRMPSKDVLKKLLAGFAFCLLSLLLVYILNILSSKPLVIAIGQKAAMWGKDSIHENNIIKSVHPTAQSVLSYANGETKIITDNAIADIIIKQMPLFNALKDKLSNDNAAKAINQTLSAPDNTAPDAGQIPPGEGLPIEEITIIPAQSSGNISGDKIFINNATKFNINTDDLLNQPLSIKYNSKQMQVLILHTHGTESFSPADAVAYSEDDSTRSQNNDLNIVKVGSEMTKELERLGVNVIHDTTLHDIPSFNGSYTSSLKTINYYIEKYPTISVVIDVHRDSMITKEGVKYRPVVQVGGSKVAQMMLVMGSSEGGLEHKNWQINLAFAAKLQKKLNDVCPNIMRPVNVRQERFNQHATTGSLLLEVGTDANSLEQAIESGKIFARTVAATMKSG